MLFSTLISAYWFYLLSQLLDFYRFSCRIVQSMQMEVFVLTSYKTNGVPFMMLQQYLHLSRYMRACVSFHLLIMYLMVETLVLLVFHQYLLCGFYNLQSLLCDPNPNSPANSEAARLFSENRREYNRRVKEIVEQSWTAD